MDLTYRLPELQDEALLRDYIQEHYDCGETRFSASRGLTSTPFPEWVEKARQSALTGDADWGRSLLYLCFDGDRLIGLLSIRYELPEELRKKYGDIGYGVRPSERGKGYATKMLWDGLDLCREKGLYRVILGCYKDNTASAEVIRRNGGILIAENDNYEPGRISQYYMILLDRRD